MLLKSIYAPRILLRKNSSDLIKPMLYSINRLPAVKVNISTKPSRFLSGHPSGQKIYCGSLETNSAIRFGSGLFCPYQFFINGKSSLKEYPHSKMPFYRFFFPFCDHPLTVSDELLCSRATHGTILTCSSLPLTFHYIHRWNNILISSTCCQNRRSCREGLQQGKRHPSFKEADTT